VSELRGVPALWRAEYSTRTGTVTDPSHPVHGFPILRSRQSFLLPAPWLPPTSFLQSFSLVIRTSRAYQPRYPGYRYQPVYRRSNVIRRRVRKDAAEEEKCQEVADLLINGKTGKELESEIKEKIKRGPVSPLKKK
jgi:hypothetical protein